MGARSGAGFLGGQRPGYRLVASSTLGVESFAKVVDILKEQLQWSRAGRSEVLPVKPGRMKVKV
eukprot:4609966-Amphidinium_carterae.2